MVTKYEQLAERVVEIAMRFNQLDEKCQAQGQAIAGRLACLLEAPDGRVVTVDLDDDLKAIGTTHELYARPKFVQGRDGRWYFGVRMRYQMRPPLGDFLQETVVFAIRAEEPNFTSSGLRQLEGAEREIRSTEDLDAFLLDFIEETEQRLANGFVRRPIGFGFIVG